MGSTGSPYSLMAVASSYSTPARRVAHHRVGPAPARDGGHPAPLVVGAGHIGAVAGGARPRRVVGRGQLPGSVVENGVDDDRSVMAPVASSEGMGARLALTAPLSTTSTPAPS